MKKLKDILSGVTVEPLFFLTIVADMIVKLVIQNLYMEKACRVSLHMNSTICDALSRRDRMGYTNFEEIEVQKLTSGMMAIASALQGLFPVILTLFVGSWSDRHSKRKPVIMAPPIGLLLTSLCLILNVIFFFELPIIATVITDALFFPIFGGLPCLFLGVFSFIGVMSSDENKTVRTGVIATTHSISLILGLGVSGFLYNYLGFIRTFALCAVLASIAIICGYFLIEDVPLEKDKNDEVREVKPSKTFICDFFDFKYIVNTFKVCFESKMNNRRYKVLALMLLGVATAGPNHGEFAVSYLYSRYRYGWSVIQYSSLSFFHFISSTFASVITIAVFSKYLKWEDASLGIFGITSSIIAALMTAFAATGELFFLGSVVDCFMVSAHIALRSMMAKIVPPQELGQISSVFGVFQASSNFIFSPLYGVIYKNTISFFPGTIYLVSVGVKLIGLCLFMFLYIETGKLKKIQNKEEIREGVSQKEKCEACQEAEV